MLKIPSGRDPHTTIAVCVVARDESEHLPRCLTSVRAVADELIVVDTGSEDDTIAIAKSHGATVVRYAWNDHFAHARNAALQTSTSAWILMLDADEYLAPGAATAIRFAVERGELDAAWLPIHYALSVHADPIEVGRGTERDGEPEAQLRLFRRSRRLFWERCVAEGPFTWLRTATRRLSAIPGHIVNVGRVPGAREHRRPDRMRLRLLQQHVATAPEDADAWAHIGDTLAHMGRHDDALEAADKAWAQLLQFADTMAHRPDLHPAVVRAVRRKARRALNKGRVREARLVVDKALKWSIVHPDIHFLDGSLWETQALRAKSKGARRAALAQAARAFEVCTSFRGKALSPQVTEGVTSWRADTARGHALLQLKQTHHAIRAFEFALAARPSHTAARLGLAEAMLDGGEPMGALDTVEAVLPFGGPDAHLLAAQACRDLGFIDDARWFLEHANPGPSVPLQAPHRLLRLDRLQRAAGVQRPSRDDEPQAK